MAESIIPERTVIWGPDSQYYRATKDLDLTGGYALMLGDFEPGGGAPEPVIGQPAPEWLNDALIRMVAGKHSEGYVD